MSVNGINPNLSSAPVSPNAVNGSGKNPQLAALEQKLQRLTNEKKAAIRNKDKEKEQKLEQEIQAVKQQIEQLKKKEEKKQEKEEQANPNASKDLSSPPGLGNAVDRYA